MDDKKTLELVNKFFSVDYRFNTELVKTIANSLPGFYKDFNPSKTALRISRITEPTAGPYIFFLRDNSLFYWDEECPEIKQLSDDLEDYHPDYDVIHSLLWFFDANKVSDPED